MDPWNFLQPNTPARIAQGRVGHSLPTQALLHFQLDHARARDAVFAELDLPALEPHFPGCLVLRSQATDRRVFLQRPDLGRQLHPESRATVMNSNQPPTTVAIVVADGLSATAVNTHAPSVVAALSEQCIALRWSVGPTTIVQQGRVAIGDEIACLLKAEMVIVLIGERPGLSSPDSLGAYLTFGPKPGLTDEARNCISNIRPAGIPPEWAARKIMYLLQQFRVHQLSGVAIKDDMDPALWMSDPAKLS